ncbi:MAG TPA: hypothetical protein VM580_25815 [Labilithrix sp.]|nr:hypothetical protein [Labilithrix sp.]
MALQNCEDAARIPMTEEAVLELLRLHFADTETIFVCPHVPPTKEHVARRTHVIHLPPNERILALYDPSLVGDGHDGFVVTAERICWKNPSEPASSIQWRDLDPDQLSIDLEGHRLLLGDDGIVLTESEVQNACANAFHVLALSGVRWRTASGVVPRDTAHDELASPDSEADVITKRQPWTSPSEPPADTAVMRRSATPPPPHTTSFFAYASHAQRQSPDCTCWHCHTPLYETTPQCAFCGAEPKATGWLRIA